MVKVVIIEKKGAIKESVIKNFSKCGFRKNTDFKSRAKWKLSDNKYVELFAKKSGRAGSEN